MKKIFIAMAAIFTMLLSVSSPLMVKPIKAYADYDVSNLTNPLETVFEDYVSENTIPNNRYTPNQMTRNPANPITSDSYLLYFVTQHDHSAGHNIAYYPHTILVGFDSADVTIENGLFTAENIVNGFFTDAQFYKNESSDSSYSSYQIKKCIIDFENKTFKFYDSSNSLIRDSALNTNPCTDIWDIRSNIPETLTSGGLNVLVDFSPNLENNVFRAPLPDNGVTDYSKYFCMDITNNSRFGIQYFFALQEFPTDRTNINSYAPRPESGFCNALYSGQVYANEEWIYVHPFSANGIVKVLKPSQWHYIAAGESIHQDFSWSQFNLEKGKQYQAVVFAVKNDIGCASALNNYYNYAFNSDSDIAPFVIDFSEAECVYYSQFSIMNPVGYDPTDNKFGNYISSGDKSDAALYETKAYEDPTSGQLVIADKKTSGQDFETVVGAPTSGGSHGGGGYYTGSSYSGSSYNSYGGSFSSLNNYFSSFFAFISAVLNCFPSPFVVIITAGLSGLVVLGIIKVAIK